MPFNIVITYSFGTASRLLTDKKYGVRFSEERGIPFAAGLIVGEALVGVEIKLEGTDLKTYSDFDGNFSFDNVKQGEYKVIANYISYEKKTETLKISPNENELKIKLHSSN